VGCSNYPECKYIKKEPPKETGETCPNCASALVEKRGRFGPFVGCSNYPKCKYIKKENKGKGKKSASKSTAKGSNRKTGGKKKSKTTAKSAARRSTRSEETAAISD
jgi:DNA topoisomerase-1